jgi:hypothetical protein
MADLDVEAARAQISRVFGNGEVWELVRTFRTYGPGGEVLIDIWHHPELGYSVHSRDAAGRTPPPSNPDHDVRAAILTAHLDALAHEP